MNTWCQDHDVVGFERNGDLVFQTVSRDVPGGRYTSGERLVDYGAENLRPGEILALLDDPNLSDCDRQALLGVL